MFLYSLFRFNFIHFYKHNNIFLNSIENYLNWGDNNITLFLLQNNKPIMEKRRRARINQCLNELKALILDATNKDVSFGKISTRI